MKRLKIPLLFCLIFTISSCSDDVLIKFGNGGGFSGQVEEFIIDSDRNVLASDPINSIQKTIGKISKKDAKSILKMINDQQVLNIEYNQPANIYKYIEIKKGSSTKKFTWSNSEKNENTEKLGALYNLLMKMTKK